MLINYLPKQASRTFMLLINNKFYCENDISNSLITNIFILKNTLNLIIMSIYFKIIFIIKKLNKII